MFVALGGSCKHYGSVHLKGGEFHPDELAHNPLRREVLERSQALNSNSTAESTFGLADCILNRSGAENMSMTVLNAVVGAKTNRTMAYLEGQDQEAREELWGNAAKKRKFYVEQSKESSEAWRNHKRKADHLKAGDGKRKVVEKLAGAAKLEARSATRIRTVLALDAALLEAEDREQSIKSIGKGPVRKREAQRRAVLKNELEVMPANSKSCSHSYFLSFFFSTNSPPRRPSPPYALTHTPHFPFTLFRRYIEGFGR